MSTNTVIRTAPWSPARSSLLRHCPRQYALRHVLKAVPSQPDSAAKMRGRVIHAGLAAAFAAQADGELGESRRPMLARHYPAAQRAMEHHRDYPLLSDMQAAGATAEVFNVLRTIPPPHRAAILGVELPFALLVEDEEEVTGVIDLALRTGSNSAHIREWKSGSVSWEPLADDALPFYGLVAIQRWPWITRLTIGLYSTRTAREHVQNFDLVRAHTLRRRLLRDARQERQNRSSLSASTVDTTFPVTPGSHCAGCPFRSYCPQFENTQGLPVRPGVDVVAERNRLAQLLEQRP